MSGKLLSTGNIILYVDLLFTSITVVTCKAAIWVTKFN